MWFYAGWVPILLAYVIAFALLVVGTITRSICPLYVAIIGFTLWDVLWVVYGAPDRTAQETLDSTTRARTYMSYFVAVYGAGLAYFLLHLAEDQQAKVLQIISNAGVPKALILLPFALQAIAMLFFPICLGKDVIAKSKHADTLAGKTPTDANLAVLVITAWVEKVTTFSFVYVIAMIGAFLARPTG